MSDLFKKLNTLVRASLNDLNPIRRTALPMDVDAQIKDLRQRINAAVEHEEHLAETVRVLRADADRLDTKVDQAVANGRDEEARLTLEELQRAQKKLEAAEADLKAHQDAAQILIERVNMLDAAVSEARGVKEEDDTSTAQRISDLLRETRKQITTVTDRINAYFDNPSEDTTARPEPAEPKPLPQEPAEESDKPDDDLSDRLKRLSK